MLAGAVSTYVHRYGVLPGRNVVVFTNNDRAYQTALDLKACGAKVTVVDSRASSNGALPAAAKRQGVTVMSGAVVTAASGKWRVSSVDVASYSNGQTGGKLQSLACDLVAMSGGFSPVLHLFAQSGGKACWNDEKACFLPGACARGERGAAAGEFGLARALRLAVDAGAEAAKAAGFVAAQRGRRRPRNSSKAHCSRCGWSAAVSPARGPKQFVDFQNDVAAADILLAAREGFESVEHVKRYTAMGFGTDQGKLGNINGMAILAQALGKTIPETGTTTFRPNYTPCRSARSRAARPATSSIRSARPACTNGTSSTARCSRTSATGSGRGTSRRRARICMRPCSANASPCATAWASSTRRRSARSTSRARTR
jgi:sarcosine oxidase subunit alpha